MLVSLSWTILYVKVSQLHEQVAFPVVPALPLNPSHGTLNTRVRSWRSLWVCSARRSRADNDLVNGPRLIVDHNSEVVLPLRNIAVLWPLRSFCYPGCNVRG